MNASVPFATVGSAAFKLVSQILSVFLSDEDPLLPVKSP